MKLPPPDTKRRSLLSRAPFKSKTCFSSAAPVYSGLGETGDGESDRKEDSVWRDGVFIYLFFLVGKFECNLLTHVCLANAKRQSKVLTYCRFLQTGRLLKSILVFFDRF